MGTSRDGRVLRLRLEDSLARSGACDLYVLSKDYREGPGYSLYS